MSPRQWQLHPYRTAEEVREMITRAQQDTSPLVHPQDVIDAMRKEKAAVVRFNGRLADHIVGLAGTMAFFYLLCALMVGWAAWQSYFKSDNGFDPYPYAFLFFMLGGIMQSLFVPTMLTASNRSAERDRIKDEADHRAWSHLYEVNEKQLTLLKKLVEQLLNEPAAQPVSRRTSAEESGSS